MTASSSTARGHTPTPRAPRGRGAVALVAVAVSLSAHALGAALVGVSLYAAADTRDRPLSSDVEVEIASDAANPAPVGVDARASFARTHAPARASLARARAALAPAARPLSPHPSPAAPPGPSSDAVGEQPSPPPMPVLFAMSAGSVAWRPPATAAGGATSPAGTSGVAGGDAVPARDAADAGAVAVDVPARLVASRPVVYPQRARSAGVETDVKLEILVGTDGRVMDARVLFPRGYGFDAAAMDAVRDFRFSPASRAGRAVRVRMPWTVQFRLR